MAKRTRSKWLILSTVLVVLAGIAALLVAWDAYRVWAWKKDAAGIKVGDSRMSVRQIMGDPTMIFGKGTGIKIIPQQQDSLECWAYGTSFDWENAFQEKPPWFFPFRYRLFGPADKDVAIKFDDRGKVVDVHIPK